MTISITETDGTKRTMRGAIQNISIDLTSNTLQMKVIGITKIFTYDVTGIVKISNKEEIYS